MPGMCCERQALPMHTQQVGATGLETSTAIVGLSALMKLVPLSNEQIGVQSKAVAGALQRRQEWSCTGQPLQNAAV